LARDLNLIDAWTGPTPDVGYAEFINATRLPDLGVRVILRDRTGHMASVDVPLHAWNQFIKATVKEAHELGYKLK